MTEYTFKVNGVNFAQLVNKYAYQTDTVPVESNRVRTMDGVDHVVVLRHKGVLRVGINPADSAAFVNFCAELQKSPVEVEYTSLQHNADVVKTMTVSGMPISFGLKNANRTILDKLELTFTEL